MTQRWFMFKSKFEKHCSKVLINSKFLKICIYLNSMLHCLHQLFNGNNGMLTNLICSIKYHIQNIFKWVRNPLVKQSVQGSFRCMEKIGFTKTEAVFSAPRCWFVITIFHKRNQESSEKWPTVRLGKAIYKMRRKHFIVSESKDVITYRTMVMCERGTGHNWESVPWPELE